MLSWCRWHEAQQGPPCRIVAQVGRWLLRWGWALLASACPTPHRRCLRAGGETAHRSADLHPFLQPTHPPSPPTLTTTLHPDPDPRRADPGGGRRPRGRRLGGPGERAGAPARLLPTVSSAAWAVALPPPLLAAAPPTGPRPRCRPQELRRVMEGVVSLRVPLVAKTEVGARWGSLAPVE